MHDAPLDDLVRRFLADDPAAIDPELPDLVRLLHDRNAAEDWHKHGVFKDHLLGVYRILRLWKQPREICLCGLLHSVYSNEYVDLALFDVEKDRDGLRQRIGAETENLIHLFCTMPRTQFAVDLLAFDEIPAAGMVLRAPGGKQPVQLTGRQAAAFLVVTLADLAEQWFSWQDEIMAGYPYLGEKQGAREHWASALWPGPLRPSVGNLSLLSRLARLLPATGIPVPPIFDRCAAVLPKEEESAAAALYWQVVAQNTPFASSAHAQQCLAAALKHNPWVGEPHLVLAQLALLEGDYPAAERHATEGLRLLLEWGTPWDKRIPWSGWVAWARILLGNARARTWPTTLREHNNLGLVVPAESAGSDPSPVGG